MTQQLGPFYGLRVLDLSRVLAGPFCATIFADLGAEVIKVEAPWGDDSRACGPYVDGVSAYYRVVNRSKKGVTLDLKKEADRETLLRLVERADVVIENFRPGVLENLGIGPEDMLSVNPKIIVTSISGFGQSGSMSRMPAYDLVAQALSGIMSVTGQPGGTPTRVGISLGDIVPGLFATIATMAALHDRELTGHGQHVDIAMYDSLVSILESVGMRGLYEERPPEPVGNDHAMTVPFSTYQAKDGQVVIATSNERLYQRCATALGLEESLGDEKFKDNSQRVIHREEFRAMVESAIAQWPVEEVVERLSKAGVPTSEVWNVRESLSSDLAAERGVVVDEGDGFKTLASPIRIRGMVPPQPAPALGEHNHLLEKWLAESPR